MRNMKLMYIKGRNSGDLTEKDVLNRMNDTEKKLYHHLNKGNGCYLCEDTEGFKFCDSANGWGESYLYVANDKIVINCEDTDLYDYDLLYNPAIRKKHEDGCYYYNLNHYKAACKQWAWVAVRGEVEFMNPIKAFYGW